MKRLLLALCGFMLAAANAPASDPAEIPKLTVEFHNERLSVRADRVPLGKLIEEIKEKCGIHFIVRDQQSAASLITLELKDAAPANALEEILRGLNFAYFYSGARLAQVVILPVVGGMTGAGGRAPTLGGRFPGAANLKPTGAAIKRTPEQTKEESRVASKLEAIDDLEEKNDPNSIAALAALLSDPNREVKDAALQALANRDGSNITQLIRRGLNDRDPGFRLEVLEVLADRGDLDSLRRAKSDADKEVRERAGDLLENAKP